MVHTACSAAARTHVVSIGIFNSSNLWLWCAAIQQLMKKICRWRKKLQGRYLVWYQVPDDTPTYLPKHKELIASSYNQHFPQNYRHLHVSTQKVLTMGKKSKKGISRATQHHGKSQTKKRVEGKKKPAQSQQASAETEATIEPQTNVAAAEATLVKEPTIVEEPSVVEETKPAEVSSNEKNEYMGIVQTRSEESMSIPSPLMGNLHLFSPSQAKLANTLCKPPSNQAHVFDKWSVETTVDDEKKVKLMEQLERMDKAYPSGGLVGYVKNAKDLLERSKRGENPLEGWVPSVPNGELFEIGTENYNEVENVGLGEMGKCGFALVAGGLGERLGYSGIKLGLPTELATETTYLQYYIETILAIQSRYAKNIKLPLCIMVSNDTSAGTTKLLEENSYFGMDKDQITIVQQGDGVPALMDNDAKIAMHSTDPYQIQAKPHGHGDIHALLHSNGVAKCWCEKGLEWVIFFQDTNGLAFHTLPLALGVSKKGNLIMNSVAVPRKGKQAVGGVTKLTNTKTGEERTINVEYNQLDPLLRANGYPDGDVNDEKTGFSPFPGNINQLLFQLKPYTKALERTKGAMPEFVNPKYADESKTIFKKPTRLECMMQDFPTILDSDESKQVGFTSIAAELCFSPVKNATADGVKLQSNGTAPGVAATGEADQYAAVRKIMKSIGCEIEDAATAVFDGIEVIPGPEIVLKPSFVVCPAEYKQQFPSPSKIKISSRSSLVVQGHGVVIESLDLDGALVIECEEGASGVIRDLVVKNLGWKKVADKSEESKEYIRIRGYHLEKVETKVIVFKKDGSIEGYSPVVVEALTKAKSPTPVSESKEVNPTKIETREKVEIATKATETPKKAAVTKKILSTPSPTPKKTARGQNVTNAPDLSRPSTPEVVNGQQQCCCIC